MIVDSHTAPKGYNQVNFFIELIFLLVILKEQEEMKYIVNKAGRERRGEEYSFLAEGEAGD